MTDLLGNQVMSSFMNINTAMPMLKSGKLRPLVITSAKRSPLLPDVPTLEESGIKGANVYSWQAVAGPHGLSPELKTKLRNAIAEIMNDPATKAKMQDLGFELVLDTGGFRQVPGRRIRALGQTDRRPEDYGQLGTGVGLAIGCQVLPPPTLDDGTWRFQAAREDGRMRLGALMPAEPPPMNLQ